MIGNFNIRDNDWDPNYPHHSIHTKDLLTLAESLGLDLLLCHKLYSAISPSICHQFSWS